MPLMPIVEPPKPAKLLSSREAAKMLNISDRTLWKLRNSGEIPAIKIIRSVRFDQNDLQKYIDRNREAAKA